MKKTIALLVGLFAAAVAQDNIGLTQTVLTETVGTTQYVGIAKVSTIKSVTTNDAAWQIVRVTPTDVKTAYNPALSNNAAIWSSVWANRASLQYK